MALVVNGEIVSEELIRQESERLARDPRWTRIKGKSDLSRRLREAAEFSAVHRILLEQTAANDPRPVDAAALEREVERRRSAGGFQLGFDDGCLRQEIERLMRLERTTRELIAKAAKPSEAEIEEFYRANRENFRKPGLFHAAHIVCHVNDAQSEEEARSRIESALAELERGEDFSGVAERYSDCKGNGGDLGTFPAGYMVEEFEQAIRPLEPGQRTGIFTTPFGFHIAELRSKSRGEPADFEDVRPDIDRVLSAMHEHQEYIRRIEEIRTRAGIRRIPDRDEDEAEGGNKAHI